MAIVQISRITHRKGLTENLPQLSGAEFGWCLDSRRLFIGNGTLEEGSPVIGNTEILTEFSDVVALSSYTYKDLAVGYAPQTGPSLNEPVIRTVQERLDDFASVRGFGAVGDGVTDDTAAIKRALRELYTVQANTAVRRSLYFPAGVYLVSETIVIPSFAKLVGEGADSTVILLVSTSADNYVARYGDSRYQSGVNIGTNGAIPPEGIEISSMSFVSEKDSNVFLVESAKRCSFTSVNFKGSLTEADIQAVSSGSIAVDFSSTGLLVCDQILFDKCGFLNCMYGIETLEEIRSVTVSNCEFNTLYRGISLGDGLVVNGGATGFRAIHNKFDRIFSHGIIYRNVELNVSAYNVFYDVANGFTQDPITSIVLLGNDNNVSLSDMFERIDGDALIHPRIAMVGSATETVTQIQLGRYTRESGRTKVLNDFQINQPVVTVNTLDTQAFRIDYTIVRDAGIRTGTITVTGPNKYQPVANQTVTYTDDYTENLDTGVTLEVIQTTLNNVLLRYSTTSAGYSATLTYSIEHLA